MRGGWRGWGGALSALACLLILCAGCDSLNPYRVGEKAVAKYMVTFLGPAERYQVHIDKEGARLRGGYVAHMTIAGDEVRTASGFSMRRLDADLYGVRFNSKTRKLQSIERSAFTAFVTQAAANEYLGAHNRGIPGLSVTFEPGTFVAHAAPQLLGVTIPVTLKGRAYAADGALINFETDQLAVSRLTIPLAAVRYVQDKVNPVFDVRELKLPAEVESVESGAGEMIMRGRVKLPQG